MKKSYTLLFPVLLFLTALVYVGFTSQTEQKDDSAEVREGKVTPRFAQFLENAELAKKQVEVPQILKQQHLRDFFVKYDIETIKSAPSLMEEAIGLAKKRKIRLQKLAILNPQLVVEQSFRLDEWDALPEELKKEVEQPFSEVASYEVLPICNKDQTKFVDAQHLDAFRTFGGRDVTVVDSRQAVPSKGSLASYGYNLGKLAVLSDSPLRQLDVREIEVAKKYFNESSRGLGVDPLTGQASRHDIVAVFGGVLHGFKSQENLDELQDSLNRIERQLGDSFGEVLVAMNDSDQPVDVSSLEQFAATAASTWSETTKSVLFIRVVFPDMTTAPFEQAELETVLTQISGDVDNFSYGKTSFSSVEATSQVFTVANNHNFYEETADTAGKSSELRDEAKALATAAGYNLGNYDIVGVIFPNIEIGFGGLASIGTGTTHMINGGRWSESNIWYGTFLHEFGHNYGIVHANYWQTTDGSVMGAGSHIEYGDIFDVMGSSTSYPHGHFSAHGKHRLNWIPDSKMELSPKNGQTYRIYRQDIKAAYANPLLGIKYQRTGSETLYLSFRKNFTSNSALSNGLYVQWDHDGSSPRFLDMTPDSETNENNDKQDGALAIGQTFVDPTGNLYITPVATGGTSPNEWIEVLIGNSSTAPAISSTLSDTALVGQSYQYQITAAHVPTSFSIQNAPAGMTVDTTTGLISWSPTAAGTFTVDIVATNSVGSDQKTLSIEVLSDQIAAAVEQPALSFVRGGDADWLVSSDASRVGGSIAASGSINHSQTSTLTLTVEGQRNVSFDWSVSSEQNYDFLKFYLNGVQVQQISGTVGWTQVDVSLPEGTNTLAWAYEKDSSVSSGSDQGFIDNIRITGISDLTVAGVGNPSIPGVTSGGTGSYTVTASGSDIWGSNDKFHFSYETLTGDGYIIARVDNITSEVAWAKAGIVIREDLNGGGREMSLYSHASGNYTYLGYRRFIDGLKNVTKTSGTQKWLRLRRRGNVLAASLSFDGVIWFPYGQPVTYTDLAEQLYFGLAVTSADETKTATAEFSNVEVSAFSENLTSVDIDSPALAGSYSYDEPSGVHTVRGSGKILWEAHDQYHYAYKFLEGDGVAQVKIDSIDSEINWATVGIMFRENLGRNRRNFGLQVRKDNSRVFRVNRETVNIGPTIRRIFDNSARYLRIERAGDTFTASFSPDGTNWTQFGDPVVMPGLSSELLVGLMSSSPDSTKMTTARFSEFSVTSTGGAASPFPMLASKKLNGDLVQSRGVKQPIQSSTTQPQNSEQAISGSSLPTTFSDGRVEAIVRHSEDGKFLVISYERPKNYLDLGLEYRLMVTSSLDDEWVELEMENVTTTPINAILEQVEYTLLWSDAIRYFKVEEVEASQDL